MKTLFLARLMILTWGRTDKLQLVGWFLHETLVSIKSVPATPLFQAASKTAVLILSDAITRRGGEARRRCRRRRLVGRFTSRVCPAARISVQPTRLASARCPPSPRRPWLLRGLGGGRGNVATLPIDRAVKSRPVCQSQKTFLLDWEKDLCFGAGA